MLSLYKPSYVALASKQALCGRASLALGRALSGTTKSRSIERNQQKNHTSPNQPRTDNPLRAQNVKKPGFGGGPRHSGNRGSFGARPGNSGEGGSGSFANNRSSKPFAKPSSAVKPAKFQGRAPGGKKSTNRFQKDPKTVEEEDKKHAVKFMKKQKQYEQRKEKQQLQQQQQTDGALPIKRPNIALPKFISLTNLANVLKLRLGVLQENMKNLGFDEVDHDHIIDGETAVLIADELGFDVTVNEDEGLDLFPANQPEDLASVPLRPPIVTIMGHVDHGKTTILDYLRKTSVAKGEHGGITQHIGAFSVTLESAGAKGTNRNRICFLDTPGHAAFLNMRQRGANVTDIVVLVVAADDSVMPQTKEAIRHAKTAGVPIIVAVNKMDKPEADLDKVIADLAANDVDVEPYGGETQVIAVSGKTGEGIDKLEEAILTLSELIDIRSPSEGAAEGWVIESHVKKGLGNVATVLVKRGCLSSGAAIVAGTKWCRVRMLKDYQNQTIKSAGPGTPVEVLGWKELPEAGDQVLEAPSEAIAKKVADNRLRREEQLSDSKAIVEINEQRRIMKAQQEKDAIRQERIKLGLPVDDVESVSSEEAAGPKKLNFIIKADVSGSAEAVKDSIQGLGNDLVQAHVLQSAVGPVSESDITYAESANATVLAFNVGVPRDVASKAARAKIEIVLHNIIYRLLEDVTQRLSNQLEPEIRHKVIAEAAVRQVFEITMRKSKNLKIAGCKVTNGSLGRADKVKVLRNKEVVYTGTFTTMKHHKDEVNTAKKDTECGIAFDGWDKFEEGDVIQTYEELVLPRHL